MYNYNPYNSQFNQQYNSYAQNNYLNELQQMRDKIDKQIQQSQQVQQQPQSVIPASQPITQNFQLAPQQNNNSELESRYAENIDEVKNTFVMKTGLFINKEINTLWIKSINGEVRTFALNEIIEQDSKDIEIEQLKQELENMKSLLNNIQDKNIEQENVKTTSTKSTKK